MIVVVGEALVDVVVSPEGGTTRRPGGSPLNVAVGLARLGEDTALVTRLGADDDGATVRDHLEASNVRLLGEADAARTGVAAARLTSSGDAGYEFTFDWDLAPMPLPESATALHFGSLGAVLEPGRRAVTALAEAAQAAGLPVSYDPNVRPAVTPDPSSAWSDVCAQARLADLVRLSEDDAAFLLPEEAPTDVAALLLDCGAGLVVITSGDGVTTALGRAGEAALPAPAAQVVDTVGAGDSFMAALIAATLPDRRPDPRLWAPTSSDLVRYISAAHAAAGITVARAAADPPWRHELDPHWPGQA